MLQGKEFWQDRYQRILDYEETAESTDEFDRAIAWNEGADIDDSGNIVEIDVPPPKTEKRNGGVSEKRKVTEIADQLQLKPIPVNETDKAPEMPNGGHLFFGGFKHFYDAYWGTSEVCEPYLMAGALTQMGMMLGRRACISIGRNPSKRHVIYPNFYSGIIGGTSIARKSSWLRQVRYDLKSVDYDIKVMESVASAEGLIEAMSKHDDGGVVDTYGQNAPEGRRTLLLFDEMKSLFGTARRQITSTIIPRLTEAYNCPPALEVNTKHAPIQAHHPVVSILAASTGEWLSDSVTQSDVSGGFINRFAYFLYEYTEPKAEPQDPHLQPLKQWYNVLDRTRSHGDQMRQFVLSDEAWEIYEQEYNSHHKWQWENRDSFETAASAREMVNSFKIALAFAASTNELNDNKVCPHAWLHARAVAKYVSQVNAYLFKSIGAGEESKDEKVILDKLAELNNDAKKSELRQKIGGKRMSLDTFNKSLDALLRAGVVVITEKRPIRVVRVEE